MNHHAKASTAGSTTRQGSRLARAIRGALATRGASSDAEGTGAPSPTPAKGTGAPSAATATPRPRKRLALAAATASLAACASAAALLGGSGVSAASATEACPNEALRVEQHSTFLPDCRAYEQVSPADKNGNNVISDPTRTRAAADGSAAGFISLGAFGDAIGTGAATDYLTVRGASAWATHAITPPQSSITFGGEASGQEPGYDLFSPDLSKGLFRSWSPVPTAADPHENVAQVRDLYLRDDLRTAGLGAYQLLSDAPQPVSLDEPMYSFLPKVAGASPDLSRVLFESHFKLTADAPGPAACEFILTIGSCVPEVFESDHGTLRLASLIPSSGTECTGAACEPAAAAVAGSGAGAAGEFHGNPGYTPHVISDGSDGHSRVFFTDISASGAPGEGTLYMRLDHTTTVQINAANAGVTDPNGPQPATYQNASSDGKRVFFTTAEQLTADDTDTTVDLYMYNSDAPVGQRLTRLSVDHELGDQADPTQGTLGVSDDGHSVYFVTLGQIVSGQPLLGATPGIYRWHDGTVSYLGQLADATDRTDLLNHDWAQQQGLGARVTPGGAHLLFSSRTDPATGAANGHCDNGGNGGCKEALPLQRRHRTDPLRLLQPLRHPAHHRRRLQHPLRRRRLQPLPVPRPSPHR